MSKNIESEVIIIGAGSAGLAAYNMLRFNGINSIILEYFEKPARKLAATGNGRCNLTNNDLNINYYYPKENRNFLKNIFDRFNNNHALNFFHEIGIETACVNNKHFYPASYRAEDVVFALTNTININDIFYNIDIVDIKYEDNYFYISTNTNSFKCRYLIVASSLNASNFAPNKLLVKEIAKSFDIKFNKPIPILVPLKTNDTDINMLDGVRHMAKSTLFIDNEKVAEDIGQIQFNKDYLSGITIFDLSLIASSQIKKSNVKINVDFLLPLKEEDLKNYIYNRYNHFKDFSARNLFNGLIDKKIIKWIFEKYGIDINEKIKNYNPEVIYRMALNLKNYEFSIIETDTFKRAQSTYGGIDVSELNNDSLSCIKNNSLYFIGECIDISGKCGGYNLQFAWSSSFIATDDISKKIKNIV